jgi:spermidine synthase
VLRETGGLVELVAGNVVLLSSAALGTERAFGGLAASIGPTAPRRIVVGGLGFGATLRGVLDAVVTGQLATIAGHPLDDARVELVRGDVGPVVSQGAQEHDVILLDVDNGPHWASFRANARLYSPAGLAALKRALVPGGALAVWSGYRSDSFLGHLRRAGFAPSVVPLHENGRVRARAYVGRA